MRRPSNRPQNGALDARPRVNDRSDQAPVGGGVAAQPGGGLLHRSVNHRASAIVERMRQHRGRLDPFKPVQREGQSAEEGRSAGERMDGGADVVNEAGQRQFGGSRAAANHRLRLEHGHFAASLRDGDRRGQAVRS